MKKKILIIYANYGSGHKSVANYIKEKFEKLSLDLKNDILDRNVELYTIHDLINVLDEIVNEGSSEEKSKP